MEGKMSNHYLTTVVGKEVKAYKGGPESCNGRVVDVKPDFIALASENDGVIYYQTQHIKSITEDSKTNMLQTLDESNEYVNSRDFRNLMNNLLDQTIKINRGGPESKLGILLGVTKEYAVLHSEKDEVIYYNLEHIKSISVKTEEDSEETEEVESSEQEEEEVENLEPQKPMFIEVDKLDQLFKKMKYSFVTINHEGPERVEGVLVDTSNDLLTLVAKEEVLRISKFHLKNISQKNNIQQNSNSQKNDDSKGESIVSAKAKIRDQKRSQKRNRR